VVTQKLVEPGNMAVPGAPLLRIESGGAPRVEVRLDASRAAHVRPGDVVTASIELRGGNVTAVSGRVAEVARAVDAGAQTFLVKVDLPETSSAAAGTFARLRFPGPERTALVVPSTAIVRQGQLTSVFVVDGDRTHLRLVTIGAADGERVEITAGLEAGERVVLSPPVTLVDGVRVNARSAGPADAASSAPGGAGRGHAGTQ
jgi:RND family efflux transporter MFP subunit